MSKTRMAVWMNQPSYYQTVFFRELVSQGVELQVFYNSDIAQFRKGLGWQSAEAESFGQRVLSGPRDALRQAFRHRGSIHLINGLWSIPSFIVATLLLLITGARVYFHAEHPDPATTRTGIWSPLKGWWARWLMLWAHGLFVIGRRAGGYYRRMGVSNAQVIPFMYFTKRPAGMKPLVERSAAGRFVVAYVGQFVEWKRVEDVIRAMSVVSETVRDSHLRLLGAGPLAKRYLELVGELGLQDQVELRGPLTPVEVWQALEAVDVLVLPSRFDGWGLTVNEALQSGAAAICSDGCGVAEVLFENPAWGRVYPSGDVAALVSALVGMAGLRVSPVPAEVEATVGVGGRTGYFLGEVEAEAVTIY